MLPDYQVNVVTTNPHNLFLFRGRPCEKKLHLLYHDNHFDVVTSLPGLLNTNYFCDICNKGYQVFDRHRCHQVCRCCFNASREECQLTKWIHCEDCDRFFKNPTCYANHKKVPKRSHVTIKPRPKQRHARFVNASVAVWYYGKRPTQMRPTLLQKLSNSPTVRPSLLHASDQRRGRRRRFRHRRGSSRYSWCRRRRVFTKKRKAFR